MSHFPAGQPASTLAPSPNTVTQNRAMETGNTSFAAYSTTLDFGATATDPYLLFTTDANRGRFFPTAIAITATYGSVNGATINAPTANIGWFAIFNPYDNWVSLEGLQSITDNTFGAGYYDNVALETWEAFLSAPPSTAIYINLAPSGIAEDVRTVTIFGIYTG